MNNKPVAWMVDGEVYLLNEIDGEELNAIPLYIHSSKDLTDEEIHKIAQRHFHAGLGINPLDFARAILRKAQEK